VLTDGLREQARTSYDEKQRWLVLERGPLTVAVNLGNQTVTLPAPGEPLVLAASEADVSVADNAVVLPPDSVAVLTAGPAT
jgi:maltooligosyltrehalose trehalohydrolase